ncbi:GNAT family N-acetyltransferase [Candidatus Woesearchaeota archaeon]|nr:GNAT family N-acetyltransferase [Candidatus Woesearchaeota archaeon]
MVLIKEAKTKDEVLQVIFLRRKVLVSENRYSIFKSEPDKYDLTSKIYVAKQGNKVIGTARVRKEGNIYRIQRMAICKNYRKKGTGTRIIKKILKDFINKRIYLMSPKSSVSFYEQFGFKKTKKTQKGKHHTYYRLQNFQ